MYTMVGAGELGIELIETLADDKAIDLDALVVKLKEEKVIRGRAD